MTGQRTSSDGQGYVTGHQDLSLSEADTPTHQDIIPGDNVVMDIPHWFVKGVVVKLNGNGARVLYSSYNSWTWQKGDNQEGFFDGVPADVLLNQINHGNSLLILLDYRSPSTEANSIIIPYERIDIDDDSLQLLFDGNVPLLEDIQVEYTNMTRCSTIGVTITN